MTIIPPPGFTGSPLDRLNEHRPSPEKLAELKAHPDARVMMLDSLDPMVAEEGGLIWHPLKQLPEDTPLFFLGVHDEAPRFVAELPVELSSGERRGIFQAIDGLAAGEAAIYASARSLVNWHGRHGFCPVCGSGTIVTKGGWARHCPSCDTEHFPRTDPVVIMLAEYEGRALVGRQPRFPPNHYSALAGFVEVGESIEEAVARELKEEAGVIVSDVRYVSSQPWPFPSSLMIGCVATVIDDRIILDQEELEDARWVSRDDARRSLEGGGSFHTPPPFAIAHTLIRHWAYS